MSCSRCAGLMVPLGLIDWEGKYLSCPAHKCVACGHETDTVIARHHEQRPRRRSNMRNPKIPSANMAVILRG
jgi:hypothetical protein